MISKLNIINVYAYGRKGSNEGLLYGKFNIVLKNGNNVVVELARPISDKFKIEYFDELTNKMKRTTIELTDYIPISDKIRIRKIPLDIKKFFKPKIKSIYFDSEIKSIKYNQRTQKKYPPSFIFDPFTGEKLIWKKIDKSVVVVAGEGIQKEPSKHDMQVMVDLLEYSGAWNQSTAPIVIDYLNPSVSAEAWIESTNFHLSKLRVLYLKMNASLILFENEIFRKLYSPFVANYKAKLDAFTELHSAIAAGNSKRAQDAHIALKLAAREGQRIAKEFIEVFREYIDPEVLRKIFLERFEAADRAMKLEVEKLN